MRGEGKPGKRQASAVFSPVTYGSYRYRKTYKNRVRVIEVAVYLLLGEKGKEALAEQHQRQRTWFDDTAARNVREPQLRSLIALQ